MERNDYTLLSRIQGLNLFAVEACYHPKCRKDYTRNPIAGRSSDEPATQKQKALEEAHKIAFIKIMKFIDPNVVLQKKVLKLMEICKMYIRFLDETNFPNKNYRPSNLKQKILKCEKYQNIISLTNPPLHLNQHWYTINWLHWMTFSTNAMI